MNSEHFTLNNNSNFNSHFQLETKKNSSHFFETYKEEIAAYGIFSIGMISLLASGFYVIEHFNPIGQVIGWSGVIASAGVGFYGANLIGELEPNVADDETANIL